MTVTITDDPTQFPAIVSPTDSDMIGTAAIQAFLQTLGDRTAGNKARLDAIAPGSGLTPGGVATIQHYASAPALTAVTGMVTGQVAIVDYGGLYEYYAASSVTVDNTSVINGNGGVGRWLAVGLGRSNLGGAYGIPQLDASAKVPLANTKLALIEFQEITDTETNDPSFPAWNTQIDSFTSTTIADSSKYVITIASALVANDILRISGRYLINVGASTTANFMIEVLDGANKVVLPATYISSGNNVGPFFVSFSTSHKMTSAMSAGTCTVKMRANRASGTNLVQILSASNLVVEAIRP